MLSLDVLALGKGTQVLHPSRDAELQYLGLFHSHPYVNACVSACLCAQLPHHHHAA